VYDAALGKSIETYDRDFRIDVSMSPTRPIDLVVRIKGVRLTPAFVIRQWKGNSTFPRAGNVGQTTKSQAREPVENGRIHP
jgi:hypothetical protein